VFVIAFYLNIYICADVVSEELNRGSICLVYVVKDPNEAVLKLIALGAKNSKNKEVNKKLIEKEIEIGMIVAKETPHLVSYSEIFEWQDYFCIKMEYCKMGDLQNQLDQK
jgi:serine/threonine protein kinase